MCRISLVVACVTWLSLVPALTSFSQQPPVCLAPAHAPQYAPHAVVPQHGVAEPSASCSPPCPECRQAADSIEHHLHAAVQHLEAAGLGEMAQAVRQRAAQQAREQALREKTEQIHSLESQLARLRAEIEELKAGQPLPVPPRAATRQVKVELCILEASLDQLAEQGMTTDEKGLGGRLPMKAETEYGSTGVPSENTPRSFRRLPVKAEAEEDSSGGFAFGILERGDEFLRIVEQLRKEGAIRVLAEPTLVALDGHPASINVGSDVPIAVPQVDGKPNLAYRSIGTHVEVLSSVLDDGKLRLHIRPEISQLDRSRTVEIGGAEMPGVHTRVVDTVVELKSGQTLAVGGIVHAEGPAEAAADPKHGTSNDAYHQHATTRRTELIVLATPTLIDVTASDAVVPRRAAESAVDREAYPPQRAARAVEDRPAR